MSLYFSGGYQFWGWFKGKPKGETAICCPTFRHTKLGPPNTQPRNRLMPTETQYGGDIASDTFTQHLSCNSLPTPDVCFVAQPLVSRNLESQSKPGTQMVNLEPCKELERRPQLFMAGIVPY